MANSSGGRTRRPNRLRALMAGGSAVCLAGLTVLPTPAFAAGAHAVQPRAASGCSSQLTGNAKWVCALYQVILGRPADPAGQSKWDAALADGETRAQVAYSIVTSYEYRTNFIDSDYQVYLGRAADPAGSNRLQSMFAEGSTDEQIDATILQSTEFYSKSGGANTGFISALYQVLLGRPADSGGLTKWQSAMAKGQSRYSVAYSIDTSQESRADAVQFFYQVFFNRPADSAGLSKWAGALDSGVTDESVISSLVGSTEFYNEVANS